MFLTFLGGYEFKALGLMKLWRAMLMVIYTVKSHTMKYRKLTLRDWWECFFFFFNIFWNWSPGKDRIKSVWFRCFILGNANCPFTSQDRLPCCRLVAAAQLRWGSPNHWVWTGGNLLMHCCDTFLSDCSTALPVAPPGTGLGPLLFLPPHPVGLQVLPLPSHPWVLALPFLA